MIKVENLSKWFGSKQAVANISFTVAKGEVLGFLGPNGAGKSTTMRMITGFIAPDAGQITIGNYSMADNPIGAKSLLGYLPENAPSYEDMTVTAFLKFIAALRGMGGKTRNDAVDRVIETCFLQSVRHQTIETLSKGFRHRTGFAQSILHDPEVLILDEPTDGLDPNQKHEVRNLIKRMGERKAIVLSTHILEEVDAVCSRVIIINNGKLVANGVPGELKARSKIAGSVVMTIRNQTYNAINARLSSLDGIKNTLCLAEKDALCQLRVFPRESGGDEALPLRLHRVGVESGWQVLELSLEEGRLDEVFREITTSDVERGAK